MWKVEDALEGRLTIGKSRGGPKNEEYLLRISGKRLWQLQKFLEETAQKGGPWFDVRMVVMLAEAVRLGKVDVDEGGPPQGSVSEALR